MKECVFNINLIDIIYGKESSQYISNRLRSNGFDFDRPIRYFYNPRNNTYTFRQEESPKPKNKLVVIGYCGVIKCYLNVSIEEAKRRYIEADGCGENEIETLDENIKVIEFDDEFGAYDVWEK